MESLIWIHMVHVYDLAKKNGGSIGIQWGFNGVYRISWDSKLPLSQLASLVRPLILGPINNWRVNLSNVNLNEPYGRRSQQYLWGHTQQIMNQGFLVRVDIDSWEIYSGVLSDIIRVLLCMYLYAQDLYLILFDTYVDVLSDPYLAQCSSVQVWRARESLRSVSNQRRKDEPAIIRCIQESHKDLIVSL